MYSNDACSYILTLNFAAFLEMCVRVTAIALLYKCTSTRTFLDGEGSGGSLPLDSAMFPVDDDGCDCNGRGCRRCGGGRGGGSAAKHSLCSAVGLISQCSRLYLLWMRVL